jgi:methylated-DNA-[protein]-cysteine S-methyltransferase
MNNPPRFPTTLEAPTQLGAFMATYSKSGLCSLNFPPRSARALEANLQDVPANVQEWHKLTCDALTSALSGKSPNRLPPLDLSEGSEFQQSVWKALSSIPYGKTLSYQEVARKIGKPKATRAVGGACGANPIPVFIPCHRVLAAHSRIGGFSAGLEWKKVLLGVEGLQLTFEGVGPVRSTDG